MPSTFYSVPLDDDEYEYNLLKFSSEKISQNQIPIVYRDEYNIKFSLGLENLFKFPYHTKRSSKVIQWLNIPSFKLFSPNKISNQDLALVHNSQYLQNIENNHKEIMARIMDEGIIARGEKIFTPRVLASCGCFRTKILDSFKYQTGGTILAALLAIKRGWSINIGGGFHDASGVLDGQRFCFYADVKLATHFVFETFPHLAKKILIIDLDAHPGIGIAYDFTADNSNDVYILDIYN